MICLIRALEGTRESTKSRMWRERAQFMLFLQQVSAMVTALALQVVLVCKGYHSRPYSSLFRVFFT